MKRRENGSSAALLEGEIERLRDRLHDAEEELRAIRHGEIDAVLVQAGDEQVYTLERPDHPFRMLVDQAPAATAALTADGALLCCNERFAALVGRSAASLQGSAVRDLVAPESHEALEAMLDEAVKDDVEATLVLRGEGPAEAIPFCLHPIGMSAFGPSFTLTDMSERKRFDELRRAQAALRASEEALRRADKRKDEFLATLAHELRSPLAPMRNAVAFLRAKGSSAPELRWAHDVIDRQVHLMARLLEDLLDVSRVALDKPELRRDLVELATVVNAAVETSFPLMERAKQELEVSLPPDPVYLRADPIRLAQVFANLLNNAAKYTDEGGHIRLTAELEGDRVVVSVSDTGIGIGSEQLPMVFDIFSQAKPALGRSQGGLGIGLSLVKGLVELHGGSVEASSEGVGKGSKFTVTLPVVDGTDAEGGLRPPHEAAAVTNASCRVLVVDDHRDSADSLAMLLKAMGHEVDRAYDGEQGIEMACKLRPQLVLLDLGMPRVDGYAACRRIRSAPGGGDMCVVALTGWGQEEDRRKSRAAGFDHHLVKPVDIRDLNALIAALGLPDGRGSTTMREQGARARDSGAVPAAGNDADGFPGEKRTRTSRRSPDTSKAFEPPESTS